MFIFAYCKALNFLYYYYYIKIKFHYNCSFHRNVVVFLHSSIVKLHKNDMGYNGLLSKLIMTAILSNTVTVYQNRL